MTIIRNEDGPIFRGKSLYKNGRRFDLDHVAWIFDCPYCELARAFEFKDAALACLDVHYFNHHKDAYVPLVEEDIKEKINKWFGGFRLRGYSAIATIREPAK